MKALKRIEVLFCGEEGFRKSIFIPVAVNLATSFLLFFVAWVFRDQIYERFRPESKFEGYPLYCTAEGYNNDKNEVLAEVYIVNLTKDISTDEKLADFIKRNSEEGEKRVDPAIHLRWIGSPATVVVTDDAQFNLNKGKLRIVPPTEANGRWKIQVDSIADRAVMRVIVTTNLRRPIDRAGKVSLPFLIEYPGK